MFTALTLNNIINEQTDEGVSSLVDAWIMVKDIELNGERNKGLYIMKSRGMNHSKQVREFVISDKGLKLVDVFLGPDGILTGSAREAHQVMEETDDALRAFARNRNDTEIERKSFMLEAKISSLRSEFESVKDELNKMYLEEELKKAITDEDYERASMIRDEMNKRK